MNVAELIAMLETVKDQSLQVAVDNGDFGYTTIPEYPAIELDSHFCLIIGS